MSPVPQWLVQRLLLPDAISFSGLNSKLEAAFPNGNATSDKPLGCGRGLYEATGPCETRFSVLWSSWHRNGL